MGAKPRPSNHPTGRPSPGCRRRRRPTTRSYHALQRQEHRSDGDQQHHERDQSDEAEHQRLRLRTTRSSKSLISAVGPPTSRRRARRCGTWAGGAHPGDAFPPDRSSGFDDSTAESSAFDSPSPNTGGDTEMTPGACVISWRHRVQDGLLRRGRRRIAVGEGDQYPAPDPAPRSERLGGGRDTARTHGSPGTAAACCCPATSRMPARPGRAGTPWPPAPKPTAAA